MGKTDGNQLALALQADYMFQRGALAWGPMASVEYYRLEADAFDESGAGAWNLSVGSQEGAITLASIGLRGDYLIDPASQTRAYGSVAYTAADGDDQLIGAGFIGLPAASLPVDGIDKDWADVSLGLSRTVSSRPGRAIELGAEYRGSFSNDYTSHGPPSMPDELLRKALSAGPSGPVALTPWQITTLAGDWLRQSSLSVQTSAGRTLPGPQDRERVEPNPCKLQPPSHCLTNILFAAEAEFAGFADDEVVVERNSHHLARLLDPPGHFYVGLRRGGIARRVVVHEDQRRGVKLQRAFHDFAGIDGNMVDRAGGLRLIRDQRVLGIEEKQAKFLGLAMRHGGVAVVQQRIP